MMKRALKTVAYMNMSFTSIMGPKTRKASFEESGSGRLAATKASEVLQSERTKASSIIAGEAIHSFSAIPATKLLSICVLKKAVTAIPIVKKSAVSMKSRWVERKARTSLSGLCSWSWS